MKIEHFLSPVRKVTGENQEASFLLSNKIGDYFWFHSLPSSRYEGWFCRKDEKMYRLIESIKVEDGGEVKEIENGFNHIERKRENVDELFYLSESSHSFIYELNKEATIEVYFDVRESYSSSPTKHYNLKKENGFLVLEFDPHFFLAIKCEEGENIEEIINREYSYDKKRNSLPFEREVLKGVRLKGARFIFTFADNKKEAIREAGKVFMRGVIYKDEEVSLLCAKNSLSNLLISKEKGVYAGLPWFFQFWPRDEAISLKSIFEIDKNSGKDIFFKILRKGLKRGPGGVINIDAVGWAIKRAEEIIPHMNASEKEKTRREIKKILEELLWSYTQEGFTINRAHETWMDSLKRDGARIEIQAMKLNIYKVASNISIKKEEKEFYKKMEIKMREKVRDVFFDGENLYDGYYPKQKSLEKVIRPNIFIAAYIYPELLSRKEWIICAKNALDALWLSWGGLSTLDKNHNNFCNWHTGEDSKSYHQGDSWFFVNNLTAIVLYRLDKHHFSFYVEKILEASRKEILFMGAVGCHGEVSSAHELRSEGCVNQAWSSATYIEAKKEIEN